jgi:hypothetical protein
MSGPTVTTSVIVNALLQALPLDAALASWGQATLGTTLNIRPSDCPSHMLTAEDAPFISVGNLHSRKGHVKEYVFSILVSLGIVLPPTGTPSDIFLIEQAFAVMDQDMSSHVIRILEGCTPNFQIEEILTDYEEAFDPLARLDLTITLSVPRNLARGAY